jgi:Flp pilus assembly protein TadB
MNTPDLHTLWKNQPTEEIDMNAANASAMAERSDKFQNQLANLRAREHVAGIVVLVVFTVYFFIASNAIMKAGCVLTILAALYSMWHLEQRLRRTRGAMLGLGESCLAFHRQSLVNHRDTLRSVWRWSILPLLPGMVVFRWGVAVEAGRIDWWTNAVMALILTAIFALNVYAARRLQREIEALPVPTFTL